MQEEVMFAMQHEAGVPVFGDWDLAQAALYGYGYWEAEEEVDEEVEGSEEGDGSSDDSSDWEEVDGAEAEALLAAIQLEQAELEQRQGQQQRQRRRRFPEPPFEWGMLRVRG